MSKRTMTQIGFLRFVVVHVASVGAFGVVLVALSAIGLDLLALPIGVFAYIGVWIVEKTMRKRVQETRDLDAQTIVAQLRKSGNAPEFLVYFRGFAAKPIYFFDGLAQMHNCEELIANAVAHIGPLTALDANPGAIGAGRARTSNQLWKEDAQRLALGSVGIFVYPGSRPGIAWEVELLRRTELLDKTVFLMPPLYSDENAASDWASMQAMFAAKRLVLPDYVPGGLIFRLNSISGSCERSASIHAVKSISTIEELIRSFADESMIRARVSLQRRRSSHHAS
jgi:hypothetical protein